MVEHTICSTCQADISGVAGQHLDETMHAGYYSGWRKEQTGTKTYTVNHPEQGHYESIVTGYNVAVEQFNEMEVYNHFIYWFIDSFCPSFLIDYPFSCIDRNTIIMSMYRSCILSSAVS